MELYALCDQSTLDEKQVSLEQFVTLCRDRDAEIIQYRDKHADVSEVKSRLIELRKLWDGFLIINDRFELSDYADGVHLGQEDMYAIDSDPLKAIKILRSVIGSDKIIGLSTHNAQEITISNTLDINYIGLGAYRATDTKDVANRLGDRLDQLAAESEHPVAAIGGVTFDDVFEHVLYRVMGRALYES